MVFKHGMFEWDGHVSAPQNQPGFVTSLFHKLLAGIQRSCRATGKTEGVQGLREELG